MKKREKTILPKGKRYVIKSVQTNESFEGIALFYVKIDAEAERLQKFQTIRISVSLPDNKIIGRFAAPQFVERRQNVFYQFVQDIRVLL